MNSTDITGNEHVISKALNLDNHLYFNIASDIHIVGKVYLGLTVPTITEVITIT